MRRCLAIDASRANALNKTGVGWYSYHLIEALKQVIPSDIEVVLYTRESLGQPLAQMPSHWCERVVPAIGGRLWTHVGVGHELYLRPPRAFFVPGHVLPFFMPRSVKTAITIHDVGALRFSEAYPLRERLYLKLTTAHAVKHAHCLITPSHFTRQELMVFFGDAVAQKIVVVPSGFDTSFQISGAPAVDALKKYDIQKPYFLYVGRLEHKKNTLFLVRAFHGYLQQFGGDDLLVLAGISGFGYDDVRTFIVDNHLESHVRILGYVPRVDVPALYRGAQAFLFPSLYEGFGLPVLEAMSAGCPVICGFGSAMPEVTQGAALLVDPNNVKEIAVAMEKIVTDQLLRRNLIVQGQNLVKAYTWRHTAEETLKIIHEYSLNNQ